MYKFIKRKFNKFYKGFTLIEVLAVIVILAAVSSIVIPIFTNKSLSAKQYSHKQTLAVLQKQGNAYLMAMAELPEHDEELIDELEREGYIKEIPTNPLTGVKDYSVMYRATTGKIEVTPVGEEVLDVGGGGPGGGGSLVPGPTVEITTTTGNPTEASSITYTFKFSEAVTGFEVGDVHIDNGIADEFNKISDTEYTLLVTNGGPCVQTVSVPSGVCKTSDNRLNQATSKNMTVVDVTAPAVPTFEPNTTEPTNVAVTVTIIYSNDSSVKQYKLESENIWKDYTAPVVIHQMDTLYAKAEDVSGNITAEASLIISNIDKDAPAAPMANVGAGTYNASKSVMLSGESEGTIRYTTDGSNPTIISTTYSGAITVSATTTLKAVQWDKAGNASATATYEYIIDTTPPTAVITANTTDVTYATSITYTIQFSENVSGFDATDITISIGGLSAFNKVDGNTYTVVISNTGPCIQTVSVTAGKCTDTAGNSNVAASKTINVVMSGENIAVGNYIKFGTYKINPASSIEVGQDIIWRVIKKEDKNADGKQDLMLISDKIITAKAFDASGGTEGFGFNYWPTSNIRDWLNSSATAGNVVWSHAAPTKSWNNYNNYSTRAGFLTNFTTLERGKIMTVSLTTPTTTQTYNGVPVVKNDEKVFLLLQSELSLLLSAGYTNYDAQVTPKAIDDGYQSSGYWTRGPYVNDERFVYFRTVSGLLNFEIASNGGMGVRPALYLNVSSMNVTGGTGDSYDTAYIVSW